MTLDDREHDMLTVQGEQLRVLLRSVDSLSTRLQKVSDDYHKRDLIVDRNRQFIKAVKYVFGVIFGALVVVYLKIFSQ